MEIIDISWPLSRATVEYKDKKTIEFEHVKKIDKDGVGETIICMGSHTGTHVDAPAHFLKDGMTIDAVPLGSCVGNSIVIDLTHVVDVVTAEDFEQFAIKEGDIVLLKTTNSELPSTGNFVHDFVYLDQSGALYLADKKIKAVGIDYLGIERAQKGHETHQELLQKNIVIIEGLRLKTVAPGSYFFCCLPIYTVGLEAAPARAILVAE